MANELAVMNQYNLVSLTDGDMAEAIAEEMDGLGTIPYDRVKIPAGGGLAFEIPGEDEDNPESVTELIGVILYHHSVNAYWATTFAGGGEQPDCSSIDGKTGTDKATGQTFSCALCPRNQYGSDGRGKACKNTQRVYFLREGNPVPLILSLPPTSLKYMRDYIGKRILLKGMRCYEAVTKITLKREKSADGIAYSRAVFTLVGRLPDNLCQSAKAMADMLKASDSSIGIEEDYEPAKPVNDNSDDFMEIPTEAQMDMAFPFDV